jgi:hypothetical protein
MSWYPTVNFCYTDCHTVTGLYGSGSQKEFNEAVATDASLVLAATWSAQTKELATLMKGAGFKLLANGERSPGHSQDTHICLWKRQKGKKLSRKVCFGEAAQYKNYSALQFNCCGVYTHVHPKYLNKYNDVLNILRVDIATKPKFLIPKKFKLFATTKTARYYVANFTKFFVT